MPGAGLDPAPDQLLIGVCRPLLDVLGRHLVLRDPLEEVRLRGLPRCDEWWIAHVLRQELGLLEHVEIAPLRALAMVAAEAELLEHAPGLPGQGGTRLLVLRIAPRRARAVPLNNPAKITSGHIPRSRLRTMIHALTPKVGDASVEFEQYIGSTGQDNERPGSFFRRRSGFHQLEPSPQPAIARWAVPTSTLRIALRLSLRFGGRPPSPPPPLSSLSTSHSCP